VAITISDKESEARRRQMAFPGSRHEEGQNQVWNPLLSSFGHLLVPLR
jgi:hypothetical protein